MLVEVVQPIWHAVEQVVESHRTEDKQNRTQRANNIQYFNFWRGINFPAEKSGSLHYKATCALLKLL